ncbi:MAG TPA: LacI family DNA-binding transcriptional regulator [Trebonia sp.]|nr:LacI family DNA-binding transcriptional regulator [Trebonia sp.]
MKRPTIADIAQRAGVTKAAVSFALNGQPGVSKATRERILAIAKEIGFQPNSAARALTAGRAEAFGLIIDRPARTLGSEVFFMQLISGIQDELARQHVTLLFTMVEDQDEEIELYRRWWAQRRVDGVFVVDLQVNDRRIAVLEGLHMPAVVIGTPRGSGTLPAVWQDDRSAVDTVVTYLAKLGHQRIARVGGFARYWHSRLRSEEFTSAAAAAGLTAVSVEADYSAEHGARTTRSLLGSAEPPTAIVYDNDVMAAAGLGAAQRMGRNVPADVSIVSWDDSALCELIHPAITALRRNIPAAGSQAARMLQEMAAGGYPENFREAQPALVVRDSSGQAGAPAIATPRLSA